MTNPIRLVTQNTETQVRPLQPLPRAAKIGIAALSGLIPCGIGYGFLSIGLISNPGMLVIGAASLAVSAIALLLLRSISSVKMDNKKGEVNISIAHKDEVIAPGAEPTLATQTQGDEESLQKPTHLSKASPFLATIIPVNENDIDPGEVPLSRPIAPYSDRRNDEFESWASLKFLNLKA